MSYWLTIKFDHNDAPVLKEIESTKGLFKLLLRHGFNSAYSEIFIAGSTVFETQGGYIYLEFEPSSSFDIGVLEAFVNQLEDVGVKSYHVKLFDSSSGGIQVWDKPERDITLSESKIYLLGEFDEDDDLEPTIEEQGGDVVGNIAESNLVVVGENPSSATLKRACELDIVTLSESEFWDYVE